MGYALFKLKYTILFLGADIYLVRGRRGMLRHQIGFVHDNYVVDAFRLEKVNKLPVAAAHALGGVHHQHGHVGFVKDLPGFFDPHFTQLALVVKAGGVYYHNRPHGQKLHGFVNRVGGGAPGVGHYGKILTGDSVYNAGLARVSAAKKADVYSLAGRCVVKTHCRPP